MATQQDWAKAFQDAFGPPPAPQANAYAQALQGAPQPAYDPFQAEPFAAPSAVQGPALPDPYTQSKLREKAGIVGEIVKSLPPVSFVRAGRDAFKHGLYNQPTSWTDYDDPRHRQALLDAFGAGGAIMRGGVGVIGIPEGALGAGPAKLKVPQPSTKEPPLAAETARPAAAPGQGPSAGQGARAEIQPAPAGEPAGRPGAPSPAASPPAPAAKPAGSPGGRPTGVGSAEGGGGGTGGLAEAQRAAADAAGPRQSLEGLPNKPLIINGEHFVPGPVDKVHAAAEDYAKTAGIDYKPPTTYQPVVPERAQRIAKAFDEMKHEPDNPAVQASYKALIDETLGQFQAIKRTGLNIEFIKPDQPDPYAASPRLATKDMIDNNHLWVFPTEGGFGSGESAKAALRENPMLQPTNEVIDGRQLMANDVFRIVHDYFGHFKDGNGFRAGGEENAWRSHSAMYSDLARPAMTAETRGQNSWVNYGPHGESNRNAKSAETIYAPQKIGMMPDWAINEGRHDPQVETANQQSAMAELARLPNSPFAHLQGDHPHAGTISTRLPTAKGAKEDPFTQPLRVDMAAMKQDPTSFEKNINLVKAYPNMRPQDAKGTPEQVAENFKQHVKDNLLFIHDSIEPDIRNRSKLWYDGARKIVDDRVQQTGLPDTTLAAVYAALSPQKTWFENVSLGDRVLSTYLDPAKHAWTPEMADAGAKYFGDLKYAQSLDGIAGRNLHDLKTPEDKAMWIRIHDQAHNPPGHYIVTPEGQITDQLVTSGSGMLPTRWGSLGEIAKAVAAIESGGDPKVISSLMGERHKVRNFYNNILDPSSKAGHVTIDTHAVAAGLLRPLGGNSMEVAHNFKNYAGKDKPGAAGSNVTGVQGLYPVYADAYREAAKERDLLPRELQSITWEGVRGLFPSALKKANLAAIDQIWSKYKTGAIDADQARQRILLQAGGFRPPDWVRK